MFRHVRILFTNPRARLAVLVEAEGRLHQRPRVAVEDIDVDALPVAFGEFRFGIEEVNRARRAFHEEPDNRLGSGRIMRVARGHWVETACRSDIRRQQSVALQEVGQGEQTEARAGLFQKVAAIRELLVTPAMVIHSDLLMACGLSDNWLALSSPLATGCDRQHSVGRARLSQRAVGPLPGGAMRTSRPTFVRNAG